MAPAQISNFSSESSSFNFVSPAVSLSVSEVQPKQLGLVIPKPQRLCLLVPYDDIHHARPSIPMTHVSIAQESDEQDVADEIRSILSRPRSVSSPPSRPMSTPLRPLIHRPSCNPVIFDSNFLERSNSAPDLQRPWLNVLPDSDFQRSWAETA